MSGPPRAHHRYGEHHEEHHQAHPVTSRPQHPHPDPQRAAPRQRRPRPEQQLHHQVTPAKRCSSPKPPLPTPKPATQSRPKGSPVEAVPKAAAPPRPTAAAESQPPPGSSHPQRRCSHRTGLRPLPGHKDAPPRVAAEELPARKDAAQRRTRGRCRAGTGSTAERCLPFECIPGQITNQRAASRSAGILNFSERVFGVFGCLWPGLCCLLGRAAKSV